MKGVYFYLPQIGNTLDLLFKEELDRVIIEIDLIFEVL
jgi:hypothetical protein